MPEEHSKIWVRRHERSLPSRQGKTTVRLHERKIKGTIAPLERRAEDYPRTAHAKAVDRGIKAKTILPITERNAARWREHPERIDLEGVDTPELVRRAKEIRQKRDAARSTCRECEAKLGKRKEALKPPILGPKARDPLGWEPDARSAPAFHRFNRFQREGLLKLADARGLDRRVVDWESLTDSKLSFNENKALLAEFLGHGQKAASARAQLDEFEGQLQAHLAELRFRSENARTESERKMAGAELKALAVEV